MVLSPHHRLPPSSSLQGAPEVTSGTIENEQLLKGLPSSTAMGSRRISGTGPPPLRSGSMERTQVRTS